MLCDYGCSRTSSLLFDLGCLGYKRPTPSDVCSCCTLRVLTWQTISDTGANSVDLDETACNICDSIFDFRLKPPFATMDVSKFKDTLCTGAFAETRSWCVLDMGNLLLAATYVHHFCFQTAFFVGLWHGYCVSWFVSLFSWCHYTRLPLPNTHVPSKLYVAGWILLSRCPSVSCLVSARGLSDKHCLLTFVRANVMFCVCSISWTLSTFFKCCWRRI